MQILENDKYRIEAEKGIIKKLITRGFNYADEKAMTGTAAFTFSDDDITKQKDKPDFTPYSDRTSEYDKYFQDSDKIIAEDTKNKIFTSSYLSDGAVVIESYTTNPKISQFGINLDLNFIGKKGYDYQKQIIATSPYSSNDGKYKYYIMTRPCGDFFVAAMLTEGDGWKNDYYMWGHLIKRVKLLSSFDRVYGGSGKKSIKIMLFTADTIDEAFERLQKIYQCPMCVNIVNGGFDGKALIRILGNAKSLEIIGENGNKEELRVVSELEQIHMKDYGIHTVIPYDVCGRAGMSTTVYNGKNMPDLFNKSCKAIKKPYHPDDNLCEGGCFLWEWLLNMRICEHKDFDALAREELDIVMCRNKKPVERKSIVPYQTEYPPYHIYKSDRVQEQFFGVSILLEAYKLYKDTEYLEFAVSTLTELLENNFNNGMIIRGNNDYTTVCAPVIPICDMAVILKENGDVRYSYFEEKAVEVADFLVERGFDFPTEGFVSEETDREREDGSISCTALSVLYVCRTVKNDERYIEFAEDILRLHNAWKIYSPDTRMNGSSFRTWETIWEGDCEGPAICAGHAWTIWRSEALYHLGILTGKKEYLIDSWNGFVTNFAKTKADGTMYACYEPDYIRGSGIDCVKKEQKQLDGEDKSIKYKIAHDFPEHIDSSLSRYAWIRAAYTWANKNKTQKEKELIYEIQNL